MRETNERSYRRYTVAAATIVGVISSWQPASAAPIVVVNEGGQCSVEATSKQDAIVGYAESCEQPRIDCDPIGNGWTCASYVLGKGAPGVPKSTTVSTSTTVPEPTPIATSASATDPGSGCNAIGSSLQGARRTYRTSCDAPIADCDPVNGVWICSSEMIGAAGPRDVRALAEPVSVLEPDPTDAPEAVANTDADADGKDETTNPFDVVEASYEEPTDSQPDTELASRDQATDGELPAPIEPEQEPVELAVTIDPSTHAPDGTPYCD